MELHVTSLPNMTNATSIIYIKRNELPKESSIPFSGVSESFGTVYQYNAGGRYADTIVALLHCYCMSVRTGYTKTAMPKPKLFVWWREGEYSVISAEEYQELVRNFVCTCNQ